MSKKRKREPHLEKPSIDLIQALAVEPDRGCVLVGAAQIEANLGLLLRDKFYASFETQDDYPRSLVSELLNPKSRNALLGTFWSRAALCRALGIIAPYIYTIIDKIRSLRNDFAHTPGPILLDGASMAPLLEAFSGHEVVLEQCRANFDSWNEHGKCGWSESRILFMTACYWVYFDIGSSRMRLKHWPSFPRNPKTITRIQEELEKHLRDGGTLEGIDL